jgi:hypothetical protein
MQNAEESGTLLEPLAAARSLLTTLLLAFRRRFKILIKPSRRTPRTEELTTGTFHITDHINAG